MRVFLLGLVCLAMAPLLPGSPKQRVVAQDIHWPTHWEGRALTRVPLGEREATFAKSFPGQLARFHDGTREFIFRHVTEPTRQLHSSAECLRAAGFVLGEGTSRPDAAGHLWNHFTASRGVESLVVEEAVMADSGERFTSVSEWYWAALLGRSQGPWLAVTVAGHARPG